MIKIRPMHYYKQHLSFSLLVYSLHLYTFRQCIPYYVKSSIFSGIILNFAWIKSVYYRLCSQTSKSEEEGGGSLLLK